MSEELIKNLKNYYDTKNELQKKINDLNNILYLIKSASSTHKVNLSKAQEDIEKNIKNITERRGIYEEIICQFFDRYFGIKCSFEKNESESCLVVNADDSLKKTLENSRELETTLNEYNILLESQGFETDDDIKIIKTNYETITNYINLIEKWYKCLEQLEDRTIIEPEVIERMTEILINRQTTYYELQKKYFRFIYFLEINSEKNITSKTFDYINENASLIHLVFTNNKNDKILGTNSFNRRFDCQFHVDESSAMLVSIDKNYIQCFGCGFDRTAVDYIMNYENLTITDAAYLLAEIYLIDVPENPFKSIEYADLVNKYRSVLISDNYMNFLIDNYNNIKTNRADIDEEYVEKVFGNLFAKIERIKRNEYDSNFVFEQKTKKYKSECVVDLSKIRITGAWDLD